MKTTIKTTNMKNSEIHLHLSDPVLRDFLSISLLKNECEDMENNEKLENRARPQVSNVDRAIHEAEANLTYWERKLEISRHRKAILTLIETNGWAEYDVSTETQRDLAFPLSMSFIGTIGEYEVLLSRL